MTVRFAIPFVLVSTVAMAQTPAVPDLPEEPAIPALPTGTAAPVERHSPPLPTGTPAAPAVTYQPPALPQKATPTFGTLKPPIQITSGHFPAACGGQPYPADLSQLWEAMTICTRHLEKLNALQEQVKKLDDSASGSITAAVTGGLDLPPVGGSLTGTRALPGSPPVQSTEPRLVGGGCTTIRVAVISFGDQHYTVRPNEPVGSAFTVRSISCPAAGKMTVVLAETGGTTRTLTF